MCTLTILRAGDLLRVATNRDESRQRVRAHPPFIRRAGGCLVLTPQDPQGGGTWIAANSAGLVLALLNADAGRVRETAARRSRGLIIPELADCTGLAELAWRVADIPGGTYAPCRLVVADGRNVLEAQLGARSARIRVQPIDRPLLFASSSLGDALVDGPRRTLFEQMLGDAGDMGALQDAFHAHRWRDRPAVSVHMSRPDACTVSTTVVEATPSEVRMIYQPAHGAAGTPVGLVIDRLPVNDDAAPRPRREHAAV